MAWSRVRPGDDGLPENPNFGTVTLDPRSDVFAQLMSVCSRNNGSKNPWGCLIAVAAFKLVSRYGGGRVTAVFSIEKWYGEIRVGVGAWSYRRPMTDAELRLAIGFDLSDGRIPELQAIFPIRPDLVTIAMNLADGTWERKPRNLARGGPKTEENNWGRGEKNAEIKSGRAKQLKVIAMHAEFDRPGSIAA